MSAREYAEMGMQPLDVAQSGARTPPGCRHRMLGHLLPVCFAQSGTWLKRRFHSLESCTSVLTQTQRARVVVLLETDFRATEAPQWCWVWDGPTLENNSAFEPRLAAAECATGQPAAAARPLLFPLVQLVQLCRDQP
jgi:hypothetical protein